VSERLQPRAAPVGGVGTGLFSTRPGGVSTGVWASLNLALHVGDDPAAVRVNRERVAAHFGAGSLHLPAQVHGAEVAVVDPATVEVPEWTTTGAPGADALVTALPGVPLAVLAADCLPVLAADPVAGVVAAAHAGRPGLAAGLLRATVEAMTRLGADPGRIIAVIGPAVCGRCYEVPAGMRDEVAAVLLGSAARTRDGSPSLDLPAGAEQSLRQLGVEVIHRLEVCTMEDNSVFSYRRSGGRPTGRHAGVVMLNR
jgi:YfiH family protein